jgi:SagB-type dehydrogenase family enzyme
MEKKMDGWKSCLFAAAAILGVGLMGFVVSPMTAVAMEPTLQLLKPQTDTQPFLQLLAKRESSRAYSTKPLPLQTLSNLLWAAFGISRPESGKRTAPTAMNKQEIDVYVAMEKGIYLYDAKNSLLKMIAPGDHRRATGSQAYVKDAALNLVYVADLDKSGGRSDEDKIMFASAATGFISENVYLYCTSVGLATVIRASVDRQALAELMKLRPNQKIVLAQTVGYPK